MLSPPLAPNKNTNLSFSSPFSQETNRKMITCRVKKTDGDENFKTLECLRGRLQAERQASRSAEKDAELMTKKLAELENLLKQELKLKKRAEKKLILVKKKLESMEISENSQKMDDNGSSSYEKSISSSSKGSKREMEMDGGDFVDDTWAVVAVTWPAAEQRVVSGSVDEVLDVLRRAREGLKCSLQRSMIRVGSACK